MKFKKKVDSDGFEKILSGVKNYEIRLDDFDCKVGDIIVLMEKDPKSKRLTGRKLEKTITDVHKIDINNWYYKKEEVEEKGLQIISFD